MLKKSIFLLILVFLSACQSGGPSTKLRVELSDFAITPNQLSVPAGAEIQIKVVNNGTVEHNFYIMQYGVDVGDMFDEEDIANAYWEVDAQPDESVELSFTAPDQPGTYQIVCGMPGHLQAGMVGTLEVVK
jgi:uncharacterized cupredoxin-like copper-binding protein